ncbi:MAG: methyl-accepting chemotaxis protein [Desulfovibrionaceae bacterium]
MIVVFVILLAAAASVATGLLLARRSSGEARELCTLLDCMREDGIAKNDKTGAMGNALLAPSLKALDDHVRQVRSEASQLKDRLEGEARKAEEATRGVARAREQAETSRAQGLLSAAETLEAAITGIDTATEQLQIASARAGEGARRQQQFIAEAASAMEEMNASVGEAAENATNAVTDAEAARERAESGAAVVEKTVRSIHTVADKTEALGETVSALGSQAEAIGRIMGVISDIADQTNLLALNAAIEAARAGDAGRGFAVVADEVRKLAEKTMAATGEVRSEIEAIQNGVGQARKGMDETADLVNAAVEEARESGRALTAIVTMVGETSGRIHAIAVAAQQQSAASDEVNRTISEINAISGSTGEAMASAETAVGELASRVHDLATMNKVFRLVGEGTVKSIIEELARSEDILSLERARQERALERAVARHPFLELLYITDAKGVQVVRNVAPKESASSRDQDAYGRNWGDRPWHKEAVQLGSLYVSDVYESSASGNNCITVSKPYWDARGKLLGVIAADVMVSI